MQAWLSSYESVGTREDLRDVLSRISPEETVFMSRIGKVTATNRTHEWLTEALSASNSANAQIEGSAGTLASSDIVLRSRITNYTQILRRIWSVSNTQNVLTVAGMQGTEFDHQRSLATKSLALDINAALINQASASGASGTARKLNGLLACLTTCPLDAQAAVLGQTSYNNLLQLIWAQGGRPNAAYVHGYNKRAISSWTQPSGTRNIDAAGKVIINTVGEYQSDFGTQKIFLEVEMPTDTVAVVQEDKFKVASLRPLEFKEIAYSGGNIAGEVEAEVTLEYLAENSSGKITNTATGA